MKLTKYKTAQNNPSTFSGLLENFFNENYYGGSQMDFSPVVDIAETDQLFEIQVHLPGIKKEDVEILIEKDLINISGEKKLEENTEGKNFHTRESFYGKFSRNFRMPDSVNIDKITAKQEDGILVVTLPKDEKKLAKKQIKIS